MTMMMMMHGRFIDAALEIQQRKADGNLPTDDPTVDACGHPAFPFEIPPSASAKQQQSGRQKKQTANGTGSSDTVKLSLAQWHALVAFWEHKLFVRARYVGLLFGFAAVIVGGVSVVNSHWTSFHSQFITRLSPSLRPITRANACIWLRLVTSGHVTKMAVTPFDPKTLCCTQTS